MNRDEDIEARLRRPPPDERKEAEMFDVTDSDEPPRRKRPVGPASGRQGTFKPLSEPLPPLKVPASAINRRVPSYPAWEKPPSAWNYPRLRGREERRPLPAIWPLVVAALGVVVVVIALVILPALAGFGRNSATPSSKASSTASESVGPSQSEGGASPSAVVSVTPVPSFDYQSYTVVAGDSVSKIAKKFGLQQWELLVANPQIANNVVRLRQVLRIPPPGVLTLPPATPTPAAT
jgi:LysM repeat protein